MATHHQQSGGQKTFQLARLFHTEDCYRARGLTAEELVRRTFIGVDAATFEDLRRQGSYVDVTSCESWHRLFDDRFQDVPTCGDIASAVERLGFLVERSYQKDWDHFNFGGVRLLSDYGYFVHARCDGCECRCDHGAENTGTGCESCDCACDGCYCAAGCAASHPDVVDDTEDPLMNLTATDANRSHRSRRFTLASGWHSADCKVIRSFTAEELVKLTFEPNGFSLDKYYDWHQNFKGYFEELPSARELADALMRQGIHLTKPSTDPYDFDGTCFPGLSVKAFREAFWFPRRDGCGDRPCECLCKLCGPTGCVACDCPCEGCYCAGTCADGHPVIQHDSDPSLALMWQSLSGDKNKKRYERDDRPWHSRGCTNARWLTADQIVLSFLNSDEESDDVVGVRPSVWCCKSRFENRCGVDLINEKLVASDSGPSCRELAEAARRAGIQAGPMVELVRTDQRDPFGRVVPKLKPRKRWPWERTHYVLSGMRVKDSHRIESEPSCAGCECFCALCGDCSNCPCECTGCMCSARCLTGECIVARDVPSERPRSISKVERRLGTKPNMSLGDLVVANALVRLEQGVSTNQSSDGEEKVDVPPAFKLSNKSPWHGFEAKPDECEHTGLTLTADELAYVTLTPISDEILRSYERYRVALNHVNCVNWREQVFGLLESEPTCEQLAVAVKRLGYEVKPVARVLGPRAPQHWADDVKGNEGDHESNESSLHYEFPNALADGRLLGRYYDSGRLASRRYFSDGERLDREGCYGSCECGCRHWDNIDFDFPCECEGCYCRRTCVPARVEE